MFVRRILLFFTLREVHRRVGAAEKTTEYVCARLCLCALGLLNREKPSPRTPARPSQPSFLHRPRRNGPIPCQSMVIGPLWQGFACPYVCVCVCVCVLREGAFNNCTCSSTRARTPCARVRMAVWCQTVLVVPTAAFLFLSRSGTFPPTTGLDLSEA